MALPLPLDLTSILLAGILFLIGWLTVVKPRGIPPGPYWRFPLMGHVHLMQGDVLANIRRLRQQYGDVFHLYVTTKMVVFLNGYEAIKEALVTRGDVFSDRHLVEGFEAFGYGKGIVTASGETWKEHRKFALGALREFGFGRNILQEKISEEVTEFLHSVEDTKGEAMDIRLLIHNAVSNVICNIVFGKRFEYDDPKFQHILNILDEGLKKTRVLRIVGGKIAQRIPGDPLGYHKIVKDLVMIRDELINSSMEEHMKTFDPENIRDFMDSYIKAMKEREKEGVHTAITEDQLCRVILDLFVAGSETTATTLRWALMYLLNFPDLQERIHQELQDKVGSGRLATLEDSADLPLLNAFLLEVQRQGDIVPMALPHCTSEDVVFRGHRIPQGTMVIPILDSVLSDPKVWGDPEVFRPERFLQDGKVVKPEEFIPFGIGRRVCLGESLAKMEIFLFLSAMIQRFRFEPPENQPPPEVKGVVGTAHIPNAFSMRAVGR